MAVPDHGQGIEDVPAQEDLRTDIVGDEDGGVAQDRGLVGDDPPDGVVDDLAHEYLGRMPQLEAAGDKRLHDVRTLDDLRAGGIIPARVVADNDVADLGDLQVAEGIVDPDDPGNRLSQKIADDA